MTAVAPQIWGNLGPVVDQVKRRLFERLQDRMEGDVKSNIEQRIGDEFKQKIAGAVGGKNAQEACKMITKVLLEVMNSEIAAAKQRENLKNITRLETTRSPPCDTVCSVCLDDECSECETWSILPCSHIIHQHCLMKWVERTPACPLCRCRIE